MTSTILGHPSLIVIGSLHTMEHSFTQCVEALGSARALGIISYLFQHLLFLSSSISPKWITIETCTCTQNAHLEILFPAVIKFLSFYHGKLAKIRSKACYPDSISYFFFFNCKVGFFIFQLQLDLSPKRIQLETSVCAYSKQGQIHGPKSLLEGRNAKAWPTDRRTDGPTDGRTDGQTLI